MNCDVFISYRRDGGDMTAMHIYQALKERGYNVFYDLEVLRAGKFNEALLEAIDSCQDFVLILSPHALDRCQDEGDWVRREVAEALKKKKNIVPVMLNGFKFPETLPPDIDDVRFQNGLSATTEYFSESMDRLAGRYLVSKPLETRRRAGFAKPADKSGRRGILIGAVCGGAAVLAAVALLFALGGRNNPPAVQPLPMETVAPTESSPQSDPSGAENPASDESSPVPAPSASSFQEAPAAEPTTPADQAPDEAAESAASLRTHYEALAKAELPVLRSDAPSGDSPDQNAEIPAFGGPWKRKEIHRIELTDKPAGPDAWDVSEAGDGSVMAWTENDHDQLTLYISAGGPIRLPSDMTGMFGWYSNASGLVLNGLADFSQVENATNCFSFSAFESLDFESVPFTSLKHSDGMFQRCEQMRALNLNGSIMDRIISMAHMFDGCEKLEKLDLSGLDTSRTREMFGAFMYCTSLTELDLSCLSTSRVLSMNSLFEQCVNLKKLNLSGWDTSSVTDMNFMFSGCRNLEDLDLSGFNTSEVLDMSFMFADCSSLLSLDISGFDTAKVTKMDGMFFNCDQLDRLDLSHLNTSSVTSMRQMFQGCPYLKALDLSGFNTSAVTNMAFMFYGDSRLTEVNVSSFRTDRVTDFEQMFAGCDSLPGLDLSGFSLASAENMAEMFRDCISLTSIGVDPAAFGHGDTRDMYQNTPLTGAGAQ